MNFSPDNMDNARACMDFFSESLARLKHQLRVSKDGEIADALGISKTAFSERKKRGSFPEKEVVALARERPELGIDVGYVLTGARSGSAQAAQVAVADAARQQTEEMSGTAVMEKARRQVAERPPVMGQALTTWRENLEMLLDVLLKDHPQRGISGRVILEMADKITDLEQSGLKLTADMLATLLDNLIKGRS